MNDEKDELTDKNWLKEHDSIQLDLLKMKEEMLGEISDEKDADVLEGPHGAMEPAGEEITKKNPDEPPRNGIPEEALPPLPKGPGLPDRVSKDADDEKMSSGENKEEEGGKAPVRLPEGKIPASNDLTMKIANVLQIEHKLKRRKFEIEKSTRKSKGKERPSPVKPEVDMDMTQSDTNRNGTNSVPAGLDLPVPPPPPSERKGSIEIENESERKSDDPIKSSAESIPQSHDPQGPIFRKARRVIKKVLVRKKV